MTNKSSTHEKALRINIDAVARQRWRVAGFNRSHLPWCVPISESPQWRRSAEMLAELQRARAALH